ncbi:MAG: hypothetical protein ABIH41_05015 [Nanoarchaeota archaeon]
MNKKYLVAVVISVLVTSALLSTTAGAAPTPNLQVALLDYTPDPAQPGQAIDLTLEIANSGNPSDDAWLEIVEDYPFTLLPGGDTQRVKSLRIVSGTQKLQFRLLVDKDASDGPTPLRVRYSPSTSTGNYQEATFTINVETFGARLGIDRIQQVPERLEPGQEGRLIITLTNHDDQTLRNVDLLVDLTNSYDIASIMDNTLAVQSMINARLMNINMRMESGLTPLGGSSNMKNDNGMKPTLSFVAAAPIGTSTLKRIGSIEPEQTLSITYPLRALPDTPPGIYATQVFVNYNDEDNNPFHTQSEIAIEIDSAADPLVHLKQTTLRTTDFAGQVIIEVANRGQSSMQFATITLVPDDAYTLITAPREAYLGQMEAGSSKEAIFTILPHDESLSLPVILTYRDAYNTPRTQETTLTLDIINKNYYRDMPYEMMIPWIILGAVIVILLGYFLRTSSRKKGKR